MQARPEPATARDRRWATDPVAFATEGLGLYLSRADQKLLRNPIEPRTRAERRHRQLLIKSIERAMKRKGAAVIPDVELEVKKYRPSFWFAAIAAFAARYLSRFATRMIPRSLGVKR